MDLEADDSLVSEVALQEDLVVVLVVVVQHLEVVLVLSFERIQDLTDMVNWYPLRCSLPQTSSAWASHPQIDLPVAVLLQVSLGHLMLRHPQYRYYSSLVQESEAQVLKVVLEACPFQEQVELRQSGARLVHLRLCQLEVRICR